MTTFAASQMAVVRFCAAECDRQRTGPLAVADMLTAWDYMVRTTHMFSDDPVPFIEKLGCEVEPVVNKNGFRRTPVRVGEQLLAQDYDTIVNQLANLTKHGGDLNPVQWYVEFENIHPFADGNGRVGALLFNLMLDTLDNPIVPPNVFGSTLE